MAARKITKTDGLYTPTKAESRTNSSKPTTPNGLEENAQHLTEDASELLPVEEGGPTDQTLDPQTFSSIMASLVALGEAQTRSLHDLDQVRRLDEENSERLREILNAQREQQTQLEAILILVQTLEASGKKGQTSPSFKRK